MSGKKIILSALSLSFLFFGCQKNQESGDDSISNIVYSKIYGSDSLAELIDKETASEDIKEIIDRGYLRVGMVVDQSELFSRSKEGKYEGIDVDIASMLAERLGVDLVIDTSVTEYNDLQKLLTSDKVDIIVSTYSLTSSRAASIMFSDPYLENRVCFIGNQLFISKNNIESNPIDYLKSNSVRLAVVKNSSEEAIAREIFPKANMILVGTDQEINEKVSSGEVDGAISSEVFCIIECTKNPKSINNTKTFVFEDEKDYFCVGLAPEKEGLLRFVNASLKTIHPLNIKYIEDKSKELYGY